MWREGGDKRVKKIASNPSHGRAPNTTVTDKFKKEAKPQCGIRFCIGKRNRRAGDKGT